METQTRLPVKKKYIQDWHLYNLAKTNEKRLFYELLYELSQIIEEPEYKFGRPPIPLKDLFFSAGLKIYSNYSSRKVISDLVHARGSGFIDKAPHFNTLKDFFNCDATYGLLQRLLTISAIPLRNIEDKYSIDSSGFGSYQYERWKSAKWKTKRGWQNYLKGHIMIGTKTNIICSCEVTYGNMNDNKQVPKLLSKVKGNFPMKEISADKAYSSRLTFRIIESLGAIPFIPFHRGITKKSELKNTPEIWNKMFQYFQDNREDFDKHYHKCSNVEATFSIVKRKFGEFLRCKSLVSQRNELLMKFICHNICCLVAQIFQKEIHVDFKKSMEEYINRKIELKEQNASVRNTEKRKN